MQKQLGEIIRDFERAQARVEKLAEVVPDKAWSERTDPARWSVGECIAHLNLTSEAYLPRLRVAIAEGHKLPKKSSGEYRRDPAGWFFSTMVGPLPTFGRTRIGRVKTMPGFVPKGQNPKQTVVADFKRNQDQLIELVRESDELALDKVFIRSPFGEKIRYSCYSAFVILPRHEARHIDQAVLVWGEPGDA